jgi:hypothetical protein
MEYTAMRALLILAVGLTGVAARAQTGPRSALPDAPSATVAEQQDVVAVAEASLRASGRQQKSCSMVRALRPTQPRSETIEMPRRGCDELFNPYQRFLDTRISFPLTPKEKGYLALHNLVSPASLMTIVAVSGFTVGLDSHSAYGPGWKGFGKNAGVSL